MSASATGASCACGDGRSSGQVAAAQVLVRNIVRENRKGGIAIAGQACPVLEGNDVSDNLLHGVGVRGSTRPVLLRCSLIGNEMCGVLVQDTAMAVVEECRIEGNRQGGICSTCESSTRLVSNRIFAGSAAQQPIGVVVRSRSRSVLEKVGPLLYTEKGRPPA